MAGHLSRFADVSRSSESVQPTEQPRGRSLTDQRTRGQHRQAGRLDRWTSCLRLVMRRSLSATRAQIKTLVRLAGCRRGQRRALPGPFRGTLAFPGLVAMRHSSPAPQPTTAGNPLRSPMRPRPDLPQLRNQSREPHAATRGQLRLVGRPIPMKDQTAVPNDVPRALSLHRQNPWPRLFTLCTNLRRDVLHGRSALGIICRCGGTRGSRSVHSCR